MARNTAASCSSLADTAQLHYAQLTSPASAAPAHTCRCVAQVRCSVTQMGCLQRRRHQQGFLQPAQRNMAARGDSVD